MRITLLLLLFMTSFQGFSQLFVEDFNDEANGATSGVAAGTLGGTWSVTTTPSGGAGSFSRRNLLGIGLFRANNTGTEGVWETSDIDITGTGAATISITLATALTNSSDYLRAYYVVDSGPEVLFAELLGQVGSLSTPGSAIVAGSTLKIVVRGMDNTGGSFLGWPNSLTFTDVSVTAVTVLYSRSNGTWDDNDPSNGTWSTTGFTGLASGLVPTNAMLAVIGGGFTVDLTADATVGGLDVYNTGTLTYTATNLDLGIEAGLLRVRNGGTINQNGQAGAQIDYNQNVGGASLQVDVGGTVTIEDVTLTANASSIHYITGGGSLTISEDILIGADGATLINNRTAAFTIGDRIEFSAGTNNAEFINNGIITAGTLLFDDNTNFFTNASTITFTADIAANGGGDDDNTVTNSAGATLNVVNINPANANFDFSNSGTVNQSGDFINVVAADNFDNLATGTWNWTLTPNTTFDTDMNSVLDASAIGNTFNYSAAGPQRIIPVQYSNLTLSNSGAKDANNASWSVNGNWTVTGGASFTEGTGTITFNGSGTQTISNASGETFYNLTLALGAAANTVQMNNAVSVSNTLTLTTGGLDLNANQLSITRNATAAMTATANGYLLSATAASQNAPTVWNVRTTMGTFTFPFRTAAGGTAIPYVFNKTSTGTESGTGQISVTTFGTAASNTPYPAGVTHVKDAAGVDQSANAADRYWIVNVTGYSPPPTANVTFNIANAERPTGNPTLWAQRWDGTKWVTPPITPSAANSTSVTITVPAAQMISSPWVVLNNTVQLPIELVTFTAALKNSQVELNWATASELNNDYFTIERTTNLEEFEKVVTVSGKGTIKTKSEYTAVDEAPLAGKSYYRLKQTDFDGRVSFSEVKEIFNDMPTQVFLYPNPITQGAVTFELRGGKPFEQLPVTIRDITGRSVYNSAFDLDGNGFIKAHIELSQMPAGIYIFVIDTPLGQKKKLVIR